MGRRVSKALEDTMAADRLQAQGLGNSNSNITITISNRACTMA